MRVLIAPQISQRLALRVASCERNRDRIPRRVAAGEPGDHPIGDGGEGTAEVICQARSGEWVACSAHDALGNPISAVIVVAEGHMRY